MRSSVLWSCKLALLAICGVGGGNGGGVGGSGSGCCNSGISSVPFAKEAVDVSKKTPSFNFSNQNIFKYLIS